MTSRRPARHSEVPRPQVYVMGEIEGAAPNWPLVRLYCSWRLVFDSSKWWVIQGEVEGETFTSTVSSQGVCVWNHPLACHLALKSLQGWPRLELVVRGSDSHGRHRLAGYGSWVLPTTPGTTEVLCRCWRPTGNGWLSRLRSFFLGNVPEFQQTAQLADPSHDRPGLRTEDSVDVLLRINIVHQNFKQNGLEIGDVDA
eukprot:TRINITY_DN22210_c0_g1_i1.p1 TRINITY_DN22210_c0_g1~~TRINITY_DN22210_c0_g1_i1.p1  ORF type:complete len:198 (+),score=11.99 TRINITY_DN22210_c0_g1_i1:86-679(+)